MTPRAHFPADALSPAMRRALPQGLIRRTPLRRGPWRRRNKFGAVAVHLPTGESFDSKGEYREWNRLTMLAQAGEISDLVRQPRVVLIPRRGDAPEIAWKLDAAYTEKGRTIWSDFKPRPATPREILLMKLWRHSGPGLLLITGVNGRVLKTVMPEAV